MSIFFIQRQRISICQTGKNHIPEIGKYCTISTGSRVKTLFRLIEAAFTVIRVIFIGINDAVLAGDPEGIAPPVPGNFGAFGVNIQPQTVRNVAPHGGDHGPDLFIGLIHKRLDFFQSGIQQGLQFRRIFQAFAGRSHIFRSIKNTGVIFRPQISHYLSAVILEFCRRQIPGSDSGFDRFFIFTTYRMQHQIIHAKPQFTGTESKGVFARFQGEYAQFHFPAVRLNTAAELFFRSTVQRPENGVTAAFIRKTLDDDLIFTGSRHIRIQCPVRHQIRSRRTGFGSQPDKLSPGGVLPYLGSFGKALPGFHFHPDL